MYFTSISTFLHEIFGPILFFELILFFDPKIVHGLKGNLAKMKRSKILKTREARPAINLFQEIAHSVPCSVRVFKDYCCKDHCCKASSHDRHDNLLLL